MSKAQRAIKALVAIVGDDIEIDAFRECVPCPPPTAATKYPSCQITHKPTGYCGWSRWGRTFEENAPIAAALTAYAVLTDTAGWQDRLDSGYGVLIR